jgi:hypothetical protein
MKVRTGNNDTKYHGKKQETKVRLRAGTSFLPL